MTEDKRHRNGRFASRAAVNPGKGHPGAVDGVFTLKRIIVLGAAKLEITYIATTTGQPSKANQSVEPLPIADGETPKSEILIMPLLRLTQVSETE